MGTSTPHSGVNSHPTIVAYADDDPASGEALPTTFAFKDGVTHLYAEATHFTIFRIDAEAGGKTEYVPQSGGSGSQGSGGSGKGGKSPGKSKKKSTLPDRRRWILYVKGQPETSYVPDNEVWEFKTELQAEVECLTENSFAGQWRGPCAYRVTGKVKEGVITGEASKYLKAMGSIDAPAAGTMSFALAGMTDADTGPGSGGEVSLPGGQQVPAEECLRGTGQIKVLGGGGRLDISVTGPNVAGGVSDNIDDSRMQLYPLSVLVGPSGAWVQVDQIGVWRGVLKCVPVK